MLSIKIDEESFCVFALLNRPKILLDRTVALSKTVLVIMFHEGL